VCRYRIEGISLRPTPPRYTSPIFLHVHTTPLARTHIEHRATFVLLLNMATCVLLLLGVAVRTLVLLGVAACICVCC
jgi:hypothetical protein